MKIYFIILVFQLFIAQNSMVENSKTNTPLPKKPPYYKNLTTCTPYYCDKSIENITNSKISYKKRNLSAVDDIDFIFQQIYQETCLNFSKSESQITNSIGINFNVTTGENKVTLSNRSDSPTNVSLQESVYRNTTSLTFYIGLALGLIPEVRRPDRIIDVEVNDSNINATYKQYYNITKLGDVPYLNDTNFDFKSAMFFGSDFGSIDKEKPTYTVELYKDYQYSSPVSKSFSHNDYKHMYYYYCNWSEIQNNCKHGGFPVPNDSNKCKCPNYLAGDDCERFNNKSYFGNNYDPFNYTTEGPLMANGTEQSFSIYLANTIFYLNVTSTNNKNVSIVVRNLTFERTNCNIGRSNLEIFVRRDKGAAGINFCRNSTNITLPSLSNQVFFVFKVVRENTFLNISYMDVKKNSEQNDKILKK